MTTLLATFSDANLWQRALYAFMAEKERRSGSMRTVQGYARMLQDFFGRPGKPPDQVTARTSSPSRTAPGFPAGNPRP